MADTKLESTYKLVMLVDEDDIDNIINQKIIESNHFAENILIFQSGESALGYLEANASSAEKLPEIIFLDINMPIMDGFQFLEKFEKLPASVHGRSKIVMLSSSISPKDIDRAAGNPHVKKYINKPLNGKYLAKINL